MTLALRSVRIGVLTLMSKNTTGVSQMVLPSQRANASQAATRKLASCSHMAEVLLKVGIAKREIVGKGIRIAAELTAEVQARSACAKLAVWLACVWNGGGHMCSLQDQHCAFGVSAYRHVHRAVNDMIIEVRVFTACKHKCTLVLVMQHATVWHMARLDL